MSSYWALILAGGKGSRLGYREKALIDINGQSLISYAIKSLEKVVDGIIISVRDKAQGELLEASVPGYKLVYDTYMKKGPLAGILSGLSACPQEYCFVAACDMPFINEKAVKLLFRKAEKFDAAIPRRDNGFIEPLHAVYKCKPMICETRKAMEIGETMILAPISKLNVNYVGMDEIRKIDLDLRTFMNINTHEDIQKVMNIICIKGITAQKS